MQATVFCISVAGAFPCLQHVEELLWMVPVSYCRIAQTGARGQLNMTSISDC
jgi:hypothetical protein